ncbi:radical SAM/SPASM protein FxsB, inactivated metallohydrolase extension form [Streptomyces sp. NBC_01136]|uniref:radical SAM/SPASM protein FxsBH, inactivated beta-hydroxylase extension form n=1 Tax=unclassified Streptomyces TaxID=2593676 RepID=UPI003246D580|nr:radical SAM/SPASM protein FxsB, inactivated metallohydrolase extension form [Streptomyces sp. NBC_01136]
MNGAAPLRQLVLKVHSRCDLACDHCYVYEHADQSWKGRPAFISEETLAAVAHRFAAYAEARELPSVSVILLGGEPLLVGPARMRNICAELTRALSPVTSLDLHIHTNGVRLDTRQLDVFREFDVKVSVSLDGDRAANDRHRLDRGRRSSYDRVLRAIDLLRTPEYRHLYSGLLCTVDVANDPVAVHDALAALDPPRIDYLLPHSTWDSPPPRPPNAPTAYADWLLRIFDHWDRQGRTVPVRTFESVLSTLRGGPSTTEALGLAPSDLAVVETDGSYEQADSLKTAYDGAPATGYDVFRHTFEEVAGHPGVRARQLGIDGVSDTCRRCPVVASCGGGLYAHRYSGERGFDNPSVFCADLRAFVDGVAERITDRTLSPAVFDQDELRFAGAESDRHTLSVIAARHAGEPDWDAVWRALLDLDGTPETAPHLDEILAHPYLHTLLKHCLHGRSTAPAPLAAAVVAAAVRARTSLRLAWDQPAPALYLPTLGTLTLPGPGRVRVTVTAGRPRVRTEDGRTYAPEATPEGLPEGLPAATPAVWRPLTSAVLGPGAPPVVVDDADPLRDCYPVPVAPTLAPADLDRFTERLRAACALLYEREPAPRDGVPALLATSVARVTSVTTTTTVTPLAAGTGVRLGAHGLGALGVAVDIEPEEFVRALPRAARLARLTALRETTDLNVPGNLAGRLLDEASDALGNASYWAGDPVARAAALERAGRALVELAALPEHELTPTGEVLAGELRAEWAGHHHG